MEWRAWCPATVFLTQKSAPAGSDSVPPSPLTGVPWLVAIIQPAAAISASCAGKGGERLSSSFNPFLSGHTGVSCSFPPSGENEPPPSDLSFPVSIPFCFHQLSAKCFNCSPKLHLREGSDFRGDQQSLRPDAILRRLSMSGQSFLPRAPNKSLSMARAKL